MWHFISFLLYSIKCFTTIEQPNERKKCVFMYHTADWYLNCVTIIAVVRLFDFLKVEAEGWVVFCCLAAQEWTFINKRLVKKTFYAGNLSSQLWNVSVTWHSIYEKKHGHHQQGFSKKMDLTSLGKRIMTLEWMNSKYKYKKQLNN